MIKLGVNIDHVATIRQARRTDEPDPVWAAVQAELGGADAITFHLREDRRHVNDRDAELLKRTVAARLNMEMSVNAAIVKIALRLRPDQATLVPERRAEVTTEGGLDVRRGLTAIRNVVRKLKAAGVFTSAFIEPVEDQIAAAAECGFDAVELWTGAYAQARSDAARDRALAVLETAMEAAQTHGLIINAGHGLTYRNVQRVAALGGFHEFHIGHSIVSRAVLVGMREAVAEMKRLLETAQRHQIGFVDAGDLDVQRE